MRSFTAALRRRHWCLCFVALRDMRAAQSASGYIRSAPDRAETKITPDLCVEAPQLTGSVPRAATEKQALPRLCASPFAVCDRAQERFFS